MAGQKSILKVLRALLSKKYKDPRIVDGVLKKVSDRMVELEKEGKTFGLQVYDIEAPSKVVRNIPTVGKDKQRER